MKRNGFGMDALVNSWFSREPVDTVQTGVGVGKTGFIVDVEDGVGVSSSGDEKSGVFEGSGDVEQAPSPTRNTTTKNATAA